MNVGELGAWDEGMGADREEARHEDLCEYARAILDNPEHPHRDDFGGYARETISGLLKWIERLESRLSVSCQRNMSWRAKLKEKLAAAESRAERLAEAAEQFASQYGVVEEDCAYDNSCDDSGREPRCVPCELRAALAEHRDAKAAAPEGEKEGERG